jgi:phenylacetate-CoA ligase
MVGFVWGSNAKIEKMSPLEFELRQHLRRFYLLDPFRSGPEDLTRWIAKLRRLRPTAMYGYASTLARLADHSIATGDALPRSVRGVFTTAEKLYPAQRASIERAFGCRAYDLYGSSEVQNIAAECPAGSMHVNTDFVVLESDEPLGDGGPSPFIVTSLRAYAMPFIRYRNEDCGTLLDGECSCGRGFPLLRLDVARVSDNFVLPGGKVVHGEFFTHLMYGSTGVASFQFHQTAPDHIRLLIVPAPGEGGAAGRAAAIRKSVDEINALSGSPVTVEVSEVDAIPLSSAGKHRFTRSDVSLTNVEVH